MELYRRLGMYFFVFGALLCILAGAFPMAEGMHTTLMVLLIFLGVFSALLNITDEEELGFIVAAMGFLVALVASDILLGDNPLLDSLSGFFEAVALFVGSMLCVVALKTIVEFGSQNYHGKPLEEVEIVGERFETYLWTRREKSWNFIVFIAVAVSFVAILLDVFFTLTSYASLFLLIDVVITAIFLVDLVVLYRKEPTFGRFLKSCWFDILATIPFFYFFSAVSFLRIAKLARIIKVMRFIKLHKTLKFFTQKSGMKHYLRSKPDHEKLQAEANALVKRPAATHEDVPELPSAFDSDDEAGGAMPAGLKQDDSPAREPKRARPARPVAKAKRQKRTKASR